MKEEQQATLSQRKLPLPTTDLESPKLQTEKNLNLLDKSREEKTMSSTYLNQNPLADINLRNVYVLNKNLLQGTKITQSIRARIRGFVMDQCAKQFITRDTCSLACTYIDLYLQKKGFCQVEDIQTMAIACLMLARKQHEGKLPTVSYNVFSKESLLQWEKKVVKRLEFQLCPPTYFTFAQHVAIKWDLFPSKEKKSLKKIGECQSGPNLSLRAFYEQLDCLFHVAETFKWDLQQVILNMFYLHVFLQNIPHEFSPQDLSIQQFIQCFYSKNNQFQLRFIQFLHFYSKQKTFKLSPQLGTYLKLFLPLNPSNKQLFLFNRHSVFNTFRKWDKLQTYTKQSYDLAKSVIEKIKKK